jgi:hypothetical protein
MKHIVIDTYFDMLVEVFEHEKVFFTNISQISGHSRGKYCWVIRGTNKKTGNDRDIFSIRILKRKKMFKFHVFRDYELNNRYNKYFRLIPNGYYNKPSRVVFIPKNKLKKIHFFRNIMIDIIKIHYNGFHITDKNYQKVTSWE